MSWTEPRIETLKQLWVDGFSCSQIASNLGGITRNAVIGKVHRLGLPPRAPTPKRQARPSKPRTRIIFGNIRSWKAIDPTPEPVAIDDAAIPHSQRRTLMELTPATCRWPIGQGADVFFCGGGVEEDRPYCSPHCARAYQSGRS